jgi:hypothetical protein
MTANEFLLQYNIALNKIKLNKDRMIRAEKLAKEQGRSSYYGYVSDYQDRLYSEIEELAKLAAAAELAVERVNCSEREREVLYRRYILKETWEKIAADMLYTVPHLHRLKNSALAHVKIPNEYKDKEPLE